MHKEGHLQKSSGYGGTSSSTREHSASSITRGSGLTLSHWRLNSIQSKATALVYGMKSKGSEDRRQLLGLMTLQQRRERGELIEVYKILHGLTRIDPSAFLEVRPARNGPRLVKERAMNGQRQRQILLIQSGSKVEPTAGRSENSTVAYLLQEPS